jgi:hypothetical protein
MDMFKEWQTAGCPEECLSGYNEGDEGGDNQWLEG